MKVYALYEWYAYEGDYTHSIWEEKELAELWAKAFNEEFGQDKHYGWAVSEPYEVNLALKDTATTKE